MTFNFKDEANAKTFLETIEKQFPTIIPRFPYINDGSVTMNKLCVIVPETNSINYDMILKNKCDELAESLGGLRIDC